MAADAARSPLARVLDACIGQPRSVEIDDERAPGEESHH